MSALKNFERLFKFNPFDFMKKLNAENFAEIKNRIFSTFVSDKVEEQFNIKTDETFFKLLVECYQEAGERFPQNQKVDYGEILLDLSVEPLNPNIPKSKGIIEDFKQIVSDDDLRPSMTGVYFDDGFMVGTDAHVLVKDYADNEYTKKYNKKIIDVGLFVKSKGEVVRVIDERFPEYDRVIPTSGFAHRLNIDLYALYNLAKSAAFYYKLLDSSNVRLRLTIKDENFAVNPIILADLIEYFLKKGSSTAEIKYTSPNRAIVMDFGASMGLIMPVLNYEDKDRNIADTLYYDLEKLQDFIGVGKPTRQSKPTRTRKPKETESESREQETRSENYRRYTGKFQDDNEYISRRDIEKIILKSGEVLTTNDIIDGVYRAKKKFADGGNIQVLSNSTVNEIRESAKMGYNIVQVGMISPKKRGVVLMNKDYQVRGKYPLQYKEFIEKIVNGKLANGGEFGAGGKIAMGDMVNVIAINKSGVVTNIISNGKHFLVKFADGSKIIYDRDEIQKIMSDEDYDEFKGGGVTKNLKRIVRKGTKYGKLAVKKAKPTAKRIVKKAKIGFKALANKVAKAYEGKAVKPKYQSEYGKRYSKAEAQEVGNKVAAKVKRLKGM